MMEKRECDELELVFPTSADKVEMEEYLQEFIDNGEMEIAGDGGLDKIKIFDKWLEKVQRDVNEDSADSERIPSTVYLTKRKSDNKIVGNLQIRHKLNERLLLYGGHIGDSVRPSERRKGYATEQIRLALIKCKELGIDHVLMDCDKVNVGSAKSIMNNGGILENEIYEEDTLIQRYWITLKKRFVTNPQNMKRVKEGRLKIQSFENDDFNGDIALIRFDKMNVPYMVEGIDVCMANDGYKWLEFYDYSSHIKLTAMYDEKNEFIEWYFDIAKEVGKENGLPYEDDLYLDVVVRNNGKIVLLDENELEYAYKRLEISKETYEMAYREAKNLMKRLENNKERLENFTNKYFKLMMGDEL